MPASCTIKYDKELSKIKKIWNKNVKLKFIEFKIDKELWAII